MISRTVFVSLGYIRYTHRTYRICRNVCVYSLVHIVLEQRDFLFPEKIAVLKISEKSNKIVLVW